MNTITVKKDELLAKLRENRDKHKAEYDQAVVAHRALVIEKMRERLASIEAGGEVNYSFNLPKPVEFTKQYDEGIAMLEWEQEKEIMLDQHDFQRFVLNEWEFSHQFMASTSSYNAAHRGP